MPTRLNIKISTVIKIVNEMNPDANIKTVADLKKFFKAEGGVFNYRGQSKFNELKFEGDKLLGEQFEYSPETRAANAESRATSRAEARKAAGKPERAPRTGRKNRKGGKVTAAESGLNALRKSEESLRKAGWTSPIEGGAVGKIDTMTGDGGTVKSGYYMIEPEEYKNGDLALRKVNQAAYQKYLGRPGIADFIAGVKKAPTQEPIKFKYAAMEMDPELFKVKTGKKEISVGRTYKIGNTEFRVTELSEGKVTYINAKAPRDYKTGEVARIEQPEERNVPLEKSRESAAKAAKKGATTVRGNFSSFTIGGVPDGKKKGDLWERTTAKGKKQTVKILSDPVDGKAEVISAKAFDERVPAEPKERKVKPKAEAPKTTGKIDPRKGFLNPLPKGHWAVAGLQGEEGEVKTIKVKGGTKEKKVIIRGMDTRGRTVVESFKEDKAKKTPVAKAPAATPEPPAPARRPARKAPAVVAPAEAPAAPRLTNLDRAINNLRQGKPLTNAQKAALSKFTQTVAPEPEPMKPRKRAGGGRKTPVVHTPAAAIETPATPSIAEATGPSKPLPRSRRRKAITPEQALNEQLAAESVPSTRTATTYGAPRIVLGGGNTPDLDTSTQGQALRDAIIRSQVAPRQAVIPKFVPSVLPGFASNTVPRPPLGLPGIGGVPLGSRIDVGPGELGGLYGGGGGRTPTPRVIPVPALAETQAAEAQAVQQAKGGLRDKLPKIPGPITKTLRGLGWAGNLAMLGMMGKWGIDALTGDGDGGGGDAPEVDSGGQWGPQAPMSEWEAYYYGGAPVGMPPAAAAVPQLPAPRQIYGLDPSMQTATSTNVNLGPRPYTVGRNNSFNATSNPWSNSGMFGTPNEKPLEDDVKRRRFLASMGYDVSTPEAYQMALMDFVQPSGPNHTIGKPLLYGMNQVPTGRRVMGPFAYKGPR